MRIDVRFELELHLRRNFGVHRAILKHHDSATYHKEDKLIRNGLCLIYDD